MRSTRARFLCALAAGGWAAGTAPAVRAQTLPLVRLGSTPADDMTAMYYAIQTGMYKKAGIDVELTIVGSGGAATQAVIGGALDIAKSSLIPLFAAYTKGIPVAIVTAGGIYLEKAPFGELVESADGTMRTGKDLEGKTVGVGGLGDTTQLVISIWMDKNGGDSSTLKYVEIPNSAQLAALEQHRIDAALLLNPEYTEAIISGKVKKLAPVLSAIAPQYMLGAWFAMRPWAEAHADVVRTFNRVSVESATYTNSHHAATAAMMSEVTKIPLDVISKMDRVDNYLTLDPAPIQSSIDFAAKYKMISRAFPAREIIFTPA